MSRMRTTTGDIWMLALALWWRRADRKHGRIGQMLCNSARPQDLYYLENGELIDRVNCPDEYEQP